MKIAIAVENGKICGHFGHSPSFSFYEVKDGKIVSSENIKSPGAGHGILPDFISSYDAKVVIAGGMGAGAVNGCNAKGMQVITGITGDPDEAALLFVKGELKSTNSVCSHHKEDNHGEGHNCSHHGKCSH